MQKITVLAGGTSGVAFSRGLLQALATGSTEAPVSVTIVANTANDTWLHGLKVSPDLDALMFALGSAGADTTTTVVDELAAYGVGPAWFAPDDRAVATQLVRTQMLDAGYPLSQVTEALCRRWFGADSDLRLLPMSDDRVETHVAVADDTAPSGRRTVHVLEHLHTTPEVTPAAVAVIGLDVAQPAPGVLDALTTADLVLIAPGDALAGTTVIQGLPGVSHAVANAPRTEDLSALAPDEAVARATEALALHQ